MNIRRTYSRMSFLPDNKRALDERSARVVDAVEYRLRTKLR